MAESIKVLPQFEITPPQPGKDFDGNLKKEIDGIKAANFPTGATIEITFRPDNRKRAPIYDPKEKLRTILQASEALLQSGFTVYPHLAARMLDNKTAEEAVRSFSDLGINRMFLISGDAKEPLSTDFPDSASLAQRVLEINPATKQLGFAAYPNFRHPFLSKDQLKTAQAAKLELKQKHPEVEIGFQTQFAFSAREINDLANQLPEGVNLKYGVLPPLTVGQLLKTLAFSGYSRLELVRQKPALALTLALNLAIQKLPFEVPLPQRLNLKPDGLVYTLSILNNPGITGAFIYTMGDYEASAQLYRRINAAYI